MKNRLLLAVAMALTLITAAGCSTPPTDGQTAVQQRSIDAEVDYAMQQLYAKVKGSRELLAKSRGVLVFPKVLSAGLVVGGSYGEGALRSDGLSTGYYSTGSASVGLTAGAESKAVFILFLTDEALQKFRASDGWTAGVDASVTIASLGKDGSVDTATAQSSILGFVLANSGAMIDLSLQGTKVRRMKP